MSLALVGQAGDALSGALGLAKFGLWLDEKQPILDERAIGGDLPKRIVGIWLIAVSAFQRRKGICSFARIKLKSDKGEIFVGP